MPAIRRACLGRNAWFCARFICGACRSVPKWDIGTFSCKEVRAAVEEDDPLLPRRLLPRVGGELVLEGGVGVKRGLRQRQAEEQGQGKAVGKSQKRPEKQRRGISQNPGKAVVGGGSGQDLQGVRHGSSILATGSWLVSFLKGGSSGVVEARPDPSGLSDREGGVRRNGGGSSASLRVEGRKDAGAAARPAGCGGT